MKHLILLDPLEKLTIKKDSTLQLALTLKEQGESVALIFEQNLYFSNVEEEIKFEAFDFKGVFCEETFEVKQFEIEKSRRLKLNSEVLIHVRLDPPFDSRYLRIMWMLLAIEERTGVHFINHPKGIVLINEKLKAYSSGKTVESFVGIGESELVRFLEQNSLISVSSFILKPLDLFQGLGVERIEREKVVSRFSQKVEELQGPVIVQPFLEAVQSGEVRATYFKGKHVGSIMKTPQKGEFISNIAAGATFGPYDLASEEQKSCESFCKELASLGIDWIAFDLLEGKVQEVNVTCPGLIVETSKAWNKNLFKSFQFS